MWHVWHHSSLCKLHTYLNVSFHNLQQEIHNTQFHHGTDISICEGVRGKKGGGGEEKERETRKRVGKGEGGDERETGGKGGPERRRRGGGGGERLYSLACNNSPIIARME